MMTNREYKHALKSLGPGGYHCSCCGPSPKDRPVYRRYLRRKAKDLLKKEIRDSEAA